MLRGTCRRGPKEGTGNHTRHNVGWTLGEPFDEKMKRLVATLSEQQAEAARRKAAIAAEEPCGATFSKSTVSAPRGRRGAEREEEAKLIAVS